jgi:2-haloacid dehalogenase
MDTQNNPLSQVKVIMFDVYDTLLNMEEAERKVNALLDSKRGYAIWFEMFMEYCFVDNCTGQFNKFGAIAAATMKMAGNYLGKVVADKDIAAVMELLKHLPLNEAVQDGLSALADQKFRTGALTNSPQKTVQDRMHLTGLISYFEVVLSAEQVQKYKPSLEVYHWACKQLKVDPQQVLMVSTHGWDIAGAAKAGLQTAYLSKPNQVLYELGPKPDLICSDLCDLSNQLKARIR